jgi:shikimate dehydrogenase
MAAVLGWPVEHSKSPVMMNAAFAEVGIDATMIAMGVPPERLASTVTGLRTLPMLGASVTIPHKLAVAALCDELSPAARAIGAVNCLALDGARLVGHNTDSGGFVDGALAAGCALAQRRVVLLGAGGAARAVAFGVSEAGAMVDVVARDPARVAWTRARPWSELADAFAGADLVVDCTPAGLDGASDGAFAAALPLDALPRAAWIATLIYHRSTSLLERARRSGYSTFDGRAMLVHQGARAFVLWTGRPAPIAIMTRALDDSLAK